MQTCVDYQEARRKKKLLIRVLIGIAIFVFIILPAVFLTGLWSSVRQERASRPLPVVVPNVIGQNHLRGETILKEKGLRMRVLATRWDQNQPVDVIIDQSPLGGERVEVGHSVGVTVGGKPERQITLPER